MPQMLLQNIGDLAKMRKDIKERLFNFKDKFMDYLNLLLYIISKE